MNANYFASLRVSSLALLVAACGGGDGFQTSGDQNLGADSGTGGNQPNGTGGESAGGSAGSTGGGTNPSSSGSAGNGAGSGGAHTGAGGGAAGTVADGGLNPGAGGNGGSGTEGGVAGSGGLVGAGGAAATGGNGSDAGPPVAPPPAGIVAYTYSGDATSTTPLAASAAYSFHQNGGVVTTRRSGTGAYVVDASNLTVPIRNVQVTAYDQAAHCNLSTFTDTTASVRCHDLGGVAVNARFSFLALGPAPTGAAFTAYAWANFQSDAEYTPTASYAFNASGGAITAKRTAVGTYLLEFSGLDLAAGNAQVTAYGGAEHCNVKSWSLNSVGVRCYDAAGALADSRYEVLVAQSSAAVPKIQGYATSLTPADPGGDISASPNTFNATGGKTIATRTGTGLYKVQFAGMSLSGGHVKVTGMASNKYCNAKVFAGDTVSIACVDPYDDAAVDSRFSVIAIR